MSKREGGLELPSAVGGGQGGALYKWGPGAAATNCTPSPLVRLDVRLTQ